MTCSNLFGLFQLLGNLCFCEDMFVLERLSNASQSMKTLKKLIYLYCFLYRHLRWVLSWDQKIPKWFVIHVKYRFRNSSIPRLLDCENWRSRDFDDREILTIASSMAKIKNSVDSSFPKKISRIIFGLFVVSRRLSSDNKFWPNKCVVWSVRRRAMKFMSRKILASQ
jgi:hypothetical protein